ncbi:MAG: tetratricopeptide repeat protein [Pirellulales bacterium]
MANSSEILAQARELQKAGRLEEADRLCRAILANDPDDTDALAQLARILGQRGQLDAAEGILRRAARLRPDSAEISQHLRSLLAARQFQMGLVLAKQQKIDDAIACMRRAVVQAPAFAEAHRSLGILLAGQKNFHEAADSFRRAVEHKPGNAEAHYNLALALQHQNKFEEAEADYRRALELNPQYVHAHNNLAIVLGEQERLDEAEAAFRKTIQVAPDHADAHANLADLLLKRNRPEEAEHCCRRALALSADLTGAQYDLAVALGAQNKRDDAAACYRKTIELAADHVDAHVGLSSMLLLGGSLAEGWPEYEWRLKHKDMPKSPLPRPQWQGESLAGRTILLRAEQGAGDAIQFVRYAGLVKQQGCTVLVGCTPNLKRLLATFPGLDGAVVSGQPLPHYDVHLPMLSLPGIFGTTLETIPAKVPYLFPDEASIAEWRDELGDEQALSIGIAWQGNPAQRRDEFRSIPLARFGGVAGTRGVRLYSLQFGVGREQLNDAADWPLTDFGDRLGDFHHTAALIRNLDLVISCDSAPAHLAGALGVPVWLVVPFAPDWRWMLDRADSPWYPTMRLFRQTRAGDWESAFRQIDEELARLVEAKSTSR